MTRKDYELIARTLQVCKPTPSEHNADLYSREELEQWEKTCYTFSFALAHDNPAFDRARFLKACGL